jgi:hypothetical protein
VDDFTYLAPVSNERGVVYKGIVETFFIEGFHGGVIDHHEVIKELFYFVFAVHLFKG